MVPGMQEVSGKVAVVTGASSGIGKATATRLAGEGTKVALVARSRDRLGRIAGGLDGAQAFVADMTKPRQIVSMVRSVQDQFGRIDILVNNAGQGYDAPVDLIDPRTFRYIYELNVVGPVIAMQQVIPLMREQGGGTIVNISSGTALMNLPGMSPYSSSKKALAGISLAAREELARDGITVSVVYPYITLTEFEKNTIRAIPVPPDRIEPSGPYPADSAEFVAGTIVAGIRSGEAEIFAHDWMKARRT